MSGGWKPSKAFRAAGGGLALSAGLLTGTAGCSHHEGPARPPIDQLDPHESGLQSVDINQAADQMAADLLGSRRLNQSGTQWTMVVTNMDDKTRDRTARTDFDLFLQALHARLFKQGDGRVELIVNRDKFYGERDRELEGGGGGPDPFGQAGRSGPAPAPEAISPNFSLTGVARDLPRRGSNYYQIEFTAVNLHTRQVAWTGLYSVKVGR